MSQGGGGLASSIGGLLSLGNRWKRGRIGTVACPKCGGEVSEADRFCRHCGADLRVLAGPEEAVKAVIVRRIDGIKNKSAEAILGAVDRERYTKFDDWPPFELQGPEALTREAEALQVLNEYDYETRDWKVDIIGDAAISSFVISYRGRIRNRSFEIRSRVTALLVKKGEEGWRLVHEHWSRFPDGHEGRRGPQAPLDRHRL